jgi:hypothetical protein
LAELYRPSVAPDIQRGLIRGRDRLVLPQMSNLATSILNRQQWPVITYDQIAYGYAGLYGGDPSCTGVTVVLRTPSGADRQIALDWYLPDESFNGHFGELTAGIGDGGRWQLTQMRRGTTTLVVSLPRPFGVWLQSSVLLGHIATVSAGRPIVISGTVHHYTVDR